MLVVEDDSPDHVDSHRTILYNTTIATAIADHLEENPEVFLLGSESFRKAGKNPPPPAES
jgi:hypothetical protein